MYYYGARYLDPKYSMWISTDPALGEYIPQAPINDEIRKNNQNLPGMGGIFNHINSNLYHYSANNPIKYTDPDGKSDTLTKVTQGLVCLDKPIQMFFIGLPEDGGWNISSRASNFAIVMKFSKADFGDGEQDMGSNKGAFRHALWQAMIAQTFGSETAKEIGWAHDPNILGTLFSGPFDSLEKADRYIDLMNNKIGRKIAFWHPFSSYKKLAGYVLEEFKKNGLYTVKLGDDGKYYAQKVKLSDAEYERAKEILKDLNNRGLHE